MGFSEPTPIQAGAIPIVLEGRDLIGCASTGTGKTAAFLLPVMQLLSKGPKDKSRCLILSPTRELALQIDEQAFALGYHLGMSAASVVGGVDLGPQERALKAGATMIVATPGRLLDHMRFSYCDLSSVEVVVLDEADRMLDMGFLPDIKRIFDALPKKRQTLMFSATMSPTIRRLAGEILEDPAEVTVDRQAPATAIEQTVYPVAQTRKADLLVELLDGIEVDSVLVFVKRKLDVDRVARGIRRVGLKTASFHSGRSQEDRIAALEGFRSGRVQVLVATDVAARGLDVTGISHVFNFDVPHSAEDYIHRAGRTARAGATGDVITFVAPDDEYRMRDIQKEIGIDLPRTVIDGFDHGISDSPDGGRGSRGPRGNSSRSRGPRGGSNRSSGGGAKTESQAPGTDKTEQASSETKEGGEAAPAPRRRRRRRRPSGKKPEAATPPAS